MQASLEITYFRLLFNKKYYSPKLLLLLVLVITQLPIPTIAKATTSRKAFVLNSATAFKAANRKLWEEQGIWSRNLILCIADDLPGIDPTEKRLLFNQTEIGNSIKPYFGEEAGNKFTELLVVHTFISEQVMRACNANNSDIPDEVAKRWVANTTEIAIYLNKINSKWALDDLNKIFAHHLKLTNEFIVLRYRKDYDAEIIAYDKLHTDNLKLADYISDGIIKQFPDKFKLTPVRFASE